MLRDRLAANAHDAWSRWTAHLLGQCETCADGRVMIPRASVERWKRQMETSFPELPELEQRSDFKEADIILSIIEDSR